MKRIHENSILCLEYIGDLMISGSIDKSWKFFKNDRERVRNGRKPLVSEVKYSMTYPTKSKPKKKDWITAIWTSKSPQFGKVHFDILIGDNYGNLTFCKTRCDTSSELDGVVSNVGITNFKPFKFGILFLDVTNVYVIVTFNNNSIQLWDLTCRTPFFKIDWKYQIQKCVYNKTDTSDELVFISQDFLNFYNLDKNRLVYRKRFTEGIRSVIVRSGRLYLQSMNSFTLFDIRRTLPFIKCQEHTDPVIGLIAQTKPMKRELLKDEEEELLVTAISQDSKISFSIVNQYEFKLSSKIELKKHEKAEIFCSTNIPPRHIVTGHSSGYICIYSTREKRVKWYKAHTNTVSGFCQFKDENDRMFLVSCCFDGFLVRTNVTPMIEKGREPTFEVKCRCCYNAILCVSYCEDTETIVVGTSDGEIGLYSIDLLRKYQFEASEDGSAVTRVLCGDGYLFMSTDEGKMCQWDMKKFFKSEEFSPEECLLKSFNFHETDVNVLMFHPGKINRIITTDRTGMLISWDYKKKEIMFKYQKRNSEITSVAVLRGKMFCGLADGDCIKLQHTTNEDGIPSESELI